MKLTSRLLLLLAVTSLLCGCQQITPQQSATAATLAVYSYGTANPQTVPVMRLIQPAACDIAKNPGSTVEDVVGVIENAGGINAETKAVINVLLAIYQTSIAPSQTNQAESHPYLEAVICPGWAGGLALLPGGESPSTSATSRNLPPGKWILVK